MDDWACPICSAVSFKDSEDLSLHIENHFSCSSNSQFAKGNVDSRKSEVYGTVGSSLAWLKSCKKKSEVAASASTFSSYGKGDAQNDLSLSEQLREHRARHNKRFRSEKTSYSAEVITLYSPLTTLPRDPLVDKLLMSTADDVDRDLALQLAREEEDHALARAIELSQQQIFVHQNDDNDVEILPRLPRELQNGNYAPSGLRNGASSSDSFTFNPSMKMEIFGDKNADSGFTCSFNLVNRIVTAMTADSRVDKFKICGDFAHFASDPEDYGWSCGYRNAQMLLSAIMSIPSLKEQLQIKLEGIYVPSILYLQQLMQQAWNAGWDPQGNMEHRGGIIGSKNWLGPVDLYSMLMNMGVECKIVCFVHDSDREGPHPELFLWAETYFSDSKKTYIPPLYLQHAGHSRTIAGTEIRKNQDRYYIIFDPSTKKEKVRAAGAGDLRWLNDNFLRSFGSVSKSRYELLYVTGRVLSSGELERAKQQSRSGVNGKIFVS